MEYVVVNLSGDVRREKLLGKDYYVVPMTMLVEGVLNGSHGPLFYPSSEIMKEPAAWNGMPITLGHPVDAYGASISARSPDVLEKYAIGVIFNSRYSDGKLLADGWFDVDRLKKIAPHLLQAIISNEKIELSTGLYIDYENSSGVYNGKKYIAIAKNYRPDHLAVFSDGQIGACSLNDGCGVNVANSRSWYELVSNKKKTLPSDKLDITPEKACKILKDGEVNGSPLTDDQRGMFGALCAKSQSKNEESNMSDLSENRKAEIVNELISNRDCGSPWVEEDRDALMAMPDEKLLAIHQQMLECGKLKSEVQRLKSKLETVSNKKNQKSVDEWLNDAPDEIKSAVRNAMELEKQRKEQLIKIITKNERNIFSKEFLQQKSIDELQGIAALASDSNTNKRENSSMFAANYIGVPPAIYALGEDFSREDSDMIPEPFDWNVSNYEE
ncbi:MAG: DUF2213 domain-containing protein [Halobacteria archaeon]